MISSIFKVTHKKYEHGLLDAMFFGLSCVVFVPFYTTFLPLLFWNGHGKLARQMTLLMAFCDYMGNCIKDVVSALRPSSPPARRVAVAVAVVADTKEEKENALEYGFPSSHILNIVCLSRYFLHYVLSNTQNRDPFTGMVGFATICLLVGLIGFGILYLGMHSLVDIIGGLAFGLTILAFWLSVHEYIDSFVILGQHVSSIWAALSFLLLFAYPTPEFPTPSFKYHTAFNGNRDPTDIPSISPRKRPKNLHPRADNPGLFGPNFGGSPYNTSSKVLQQDLCKTDSSLAANAMGVPVRSSGYIPVLTSSPAGKKTREGRQLGYMQKLLFFSQNESFDVDTGIRLFQYAGLAWSVVDLVPSLFSHLSL